MAECARQGIRDNGLEGRIIIIPKRSTELIVGPGENLMVGPGKNLMVGPGENLAVGPGEKLMVGPGEKLTVEPRILHKFAQIRSSRWIFLHYFKSY